MGGPGRRQSPHSSPDSSAPARRRPGRRAPGGRGVLYVGELAGGGHDLGRRVGVAGIYPVADHPADAGLFGVTGNAASLAVEDLCKNLHIKPVVIHNAGLLGVPYNDRLRPSGGSHLCLRRRGWLLGSLLVLGEGEHKGKHDGDGPQDRYDPKGGV